MEILKNIAADDAYTPAKAKQHVPKFSPMSVIDSDYALPGDETSAGVGRGEGGVGAVRRAGVRGHHRRLRRGGAFAIAWLQTLPAKLSVHRENRERERRWFSSGTTAERERR